MADHPSRFVDRHMVGWWAIGVDDPPRYANQERYRSGEYLTYEDADAMCGPLRPVEPMSEADQALIADALREAGTKAVTTLAAAVGKVWDDLLSKRMPGDPGDAAKNALVAGRPSSWEADLLIDLAGFGRDLYCEESKRIAPGPFETIREVIARAVADDGPHHELAATLGGIVTDVADEHGPDGWSKVADQWLRPGSLARSDTATAYRLLYSASPHCNVAAVL